MMCSPNPIATSSLSLLLPAEMAEADRLTIASGTPGITLMERAGQAVADAATAMTADGGRIVILAGPGNNGGDGYVAARILGEAGRDVAVIAYGAGTMLTEDAKEAASRYRGRLQPADGFDARGFDLVIDALFGAGLARPLSGAAADLVRHVGESGVPVLAVDLPSGVSGASGAVLGAAFRATTTVTFFRRKPGHLLQPGRAKCGKVIVADIGIPETVLDRILPQTSVNGPALWPDAFAAPKADGHKYDRGHAVVFSGGATQTGAARLSAMGALRAGAGLVTLFSPGLALLVNAAHLTAVMLRRCSDVGDLEAALEDRRFSVFVLGPGFGIGETARLYAKAVLQADRALVLDADGLSSFADEPEALFALLRERPGRAVLTPHDGEYARLFPDLAANPLLSKLDRAKAAAVRAGAVVLLKGSDTVIADPSGRAVINDTGTPWLATAGSGDVLAGMIAGLLARGLSSFDAAAAAVWIHGRAAELAGPGLIAEDLPGLLPRVFSELASGKV